MALLNNTIWPSSIDRWWWSKSRANTSQIDSCRVCVCLRVYWCPRVHLGLIFFFETICRLSRERQIFSICISLYLTLLASYVWRLDYCFFFCWKQQYFRFFFAASAHWHWTLLLLSKSVCVCVYCDPRTLFCCCLNIMILSLAHSLSCCLTIWSWILFDFRHDDDDDNGSSSSPYHQ